MNMWRFRKKQKQLAALENKIQKQQAIIELLLQFCKSVAYKDKLSLLSYQQLHSPSADSSEKVRMSIEKIRKL